MKEIINFSAMLTAATSKYTDLVNGMYGMNGMNVEDKKTLDHNMNLINSIYKDEMELLAQLYGYELKENKKKKWELKIPSFMCKDKD